MTFKTNIIWKRVHGTHRLRIDQTDQGFVATILRLAQPTKSCTFQTMAGCHSWFERTLIELGIKGGVKMDMVEIGLLDYLWTQRPKRWPNGELRKNGES